MDYKELVEKIRNNNVDNNCHGCALGYYAFEAANVITGLLDIAKARAEKAEAENAVLRRMQQVNIDSDAFELANEISELRKNLEDVVEQRDEAVHDRMMMKRRIGKLNAKKEKAERERDAAISDLETIMAHGGKLNTCQFCGNVQCYERGGTKPCLPKWRGQKEE